MSVPCTGSNIFSRSVAMVVVLGYCQLAFGGSGVPGPDDPLPPCDRDINPDCVLRDAEPQLQNREGALVDLTGYWVSVVTNDWRWRMVTPPKGDIASLPLNETGERAAYAWDPEADDEYTCKRFGAAALMRNPMRVRISWEDDETLMLETDHGTQTRRFHFNEDNVPNSGPSLQGASVANWQESGLKVETTNLEAAYLRRNGIPYSEDAHVTEYYDRISAFGDDLLIVTTVVYDPKYLLRKFVTSSPFKRLDDGSDWNPVPCVE